MRPPTLSTIADLFPYLTSHVAKLADPYFAETWRISRRTFVSGLGISYRRVHCSKQEAYSKRPDVDVTAVDGLSYFNRRFGRVPTFEVVEILGKDGTMREYNKPRTAEALGLHPRDVSIFTKDPRLTTQTATITVREGNIFFKTEAASAMIGPSKAILFKNKREKDTIRIRDAILMSINQRMRLPFELCVLEVLLSETVHYFERKANHLSMMMDSLINDFAFDKGIVPAMLDGAQLLQPVQKHLTSVENDVTETYKAINSLLETEASLAEVCLTAQQALADAAHMYSPPDHPSNFPPAPPFHNWEDPSNSPFQPHMSSHPNAAHQANPSMYPNSMFQPNSAPQHPSVSQPNPAPQPHSVGNYQARTDVNPDPNHQSRTDVNPDPNHQTRTDVNADPNHQTRTDVNPDSNSQARTNVNPDPYYQPTTNVSPYHHGDQYGTQSSDQPGVQRSVKEGFKRFGGMSYPSSRGPADEKGESYGSRHAPVLHTVAQGQELFNRGDSDENHQGAPHPGRDAGGHSSHGNGSHASHAPHAPHAGSHASHAPHAPHAGSHASHALHSPHHCSELTGLNTTGGHPRADESHLSAAHGSRGSAGHELYGSAAPAHGSYASAAHGPYGSSTHDPYGSASLESHGSAADASHGSGGFLALGRSRRPPGGGSHARPRDLLAAHTHLASTMLEAYQREVQSLQGVLGEMDDHLCNTRETWHMQLDAVRNHIILVSLWLSLVNVSVMLAAIFPAFLGMNLSSGLPEDSPAVFYVICGASVVLAAISYPLGRRWYLRSFQDLASSQARQMKSIRLFMMQHIDDVEDIVAACQSLPDQTITRAAFRKVIKEAVRGRYMSDSAIDFLYRCFDNNRDGLLQQAELVKMHTSQYNRPGNGPSSSPVLEEMEEPPNLTRVLRWLYGPPKNSTNPPTQSEC